MSRRRISWVRGLSSCRLTLGAFSVAIALPAGAQSPVGAQFQVNTYTDNYQYRPSVAADADGDFVVVWQSYGSSGTDTLGYSIQGQRYASNGSTLGAQFQVNTYTTSDQRRPAVAVDADGDFIVAWGSLRGSGTDPIDQSIQAQRYASSGSALGAQFQVNSYTVEIQERAAVAAAPNGDFVVMWESNRASGTDTDSWSIQGQRYASNGSTQGAQFQVNSYTTGQQMYPSVVADSAGDFIAVWVSGGASGTDTSFTSIQGQRFASTGAPQGAQFQVNSYTTSYQRRPAVAADAVGDFVVVWDSFGGSGSDATGYSVQGQRYASNGSPQGSQFQVNTYTTNGQYFASVAAASDGDFVVVWHSYGGSGTDPDDTIQGQRYASNGTALGAQFQVNTYTTSSQFFNSVAAETNGDFIVVWESVGSSGTDTSNSSIQGQRYRLITLAPLVPAMSSATRFALAAALALLGATYALKRRS